MDQELYHYGTPRHSGRYPWGSGENPYQSLNTFTGRVWNLRKQGLTESQIAKGWGMTTTQLRARNSIDKAAIRQAQASEALRLRDAGHSNVEIGRRMGINESSVRALLNPALTQRAEITATTANMLKESVAKNGYVDVGSGTETHIGISRTKLKTSIEMLKEEGYTVHYIKVPQLGTNHETTVMVLAAPGTTYKEVYQNRGNIKLVTDYTENGGRSYLGLEPINNVSSKRIQIRYREEGGSDKDGVIELRRGVDDISLGNSKYAQVRIGVDGTGYMKGMAMYSDKMPPGVDMIYNTNKPKGTPPSEVFKPQKADQDNPFGATVRQQHYTDSAGNKKLSALNIIREEGEWGNWSKTIASQVLSKQSPTLAKQQLDLSLNIRKDEFDQIKNLTNPAVKKRLLESFADDCDAASVHLKAAGFPRQSWNAILPFPDMKENEIYAPNFNNGEKVVLVRYPHGGTFELPTLIVNNKNRAAKSVIDQAKDAVGINPKVAQRLSGADFDGDTVLVIPDPHNRIKTSSPLKGLANFDPQTSYPAYEGMPKIKPATKQLKMGDVSNLITDMTIKGASDSELARAVRHSMVIIDAEKHNLNYKQSYEDNGIAALKKKYQGGENAGASTLVSRASSEQRVPLRKDAGIDPETGKKLYTTTNESYTNAQGKTVERTTSSTKMAETSNAFSLSSGMPIETAYANYANKLKAMANEARKELVATKTTEYSPSAKKAFAEQVTSLNAKLNTAIKNSPLERQAQILANSVVRAKKEANPNMDNATLKKIKGQALTEARTRVGAKKQTINITPSEWDAIQAGAISNSTLVKILNNTDLDRVKAYATPRNQPAMSAAKIARAKSMLGTGYTQAEVAAALGVSVSTMNSALDK